MSLMIKKSYKEILSEPATQAMLDYMNHISAYMESFEIFWELPKTNTYDAVSKWLLRYVPIYQDFRNVNKDIAIYLNRMSSWEAMYAD